MLGAIELVMLKINVKVIRWSSLMRIKVLQITVDTVLDKHLVFNLKVVEGITRISFIEKL